jgi:mono/diheme cytochrome c family protein
MPPFAGTAVERHALAVHLARLGGNASAGSEEVSASGGKAVFDGHCSACHGSEGAWPLQPRLKGRSASQLFELIGRLSQVRPEMPPFTGSETERRALADYLGGLSASAAGGTTEVRR